MALPIFYEKPAALSNNAHGNWRIGSNERYQFARSTNSILLAAVEFSHACLEYPIVFVKEADVAFPVAILGLKDHQNLYVSASGTWNAKYIPAYVRRYPFVLAQQSDHSDFTVCIDEAFSGFNQETGERLFSQDGEQTGFLKNAISMLQDYQAQQQRTKAFSQRLLEWDLLQPLQANTELNTGEKISLTGFMVVNQERLKQLSIEQISELVKNDEMGAVYYHLLSLNNFGRLVDLMAGVAA